MAGMCVMAGLHTTVMMHLQGLLQQVLGGNQEVVVTSGKRSPDTTNAFFQLEVSKMMCDQVSLTWQWPHIPDML